MVKLKRHQGQSVVFVALAVSFYEILEFEHAVVDLDFGCVDERLHQASSPRKCCIGYYLWLDLGNIHGQSRCINEM